MLPAPFRSLGRVLRIIRAAIVQRKFEREMDGLRLLGQAATDARYGIRCLRRSPALAIAALLSSGAISAVRRARRSAAA